MVLKHRLYTVLKHSSPPGEDPQLLLNAQDEIGPQKAIAKRGGAPFSDFSNRPYSLTT